MKEAIAYIKKSYEELQRVQWPTPKTALAYTLIVVLITLLVALLLGASDFAFTRLINELL